MKGRKHKAEGGEADFGTAKEADDATPREVYAGKGSNVEKEADERKRGGRAKRKRGGGVKHHEKGEDMKHAKHVGNIEGGMKAHAGRAPRKSGGRTGSNFSPLSSAHGGSPPRDHKVTEID
jgi:hypothetical protein